MCLFRKALSLGWLPPPQSARPITMCQTLPARPTTPKSNYVHGRPKSWERLVWSPPPLLVTNPDVVRRPSPVLPPWPRQRPRADVLGDVSPLQHSESLRERTGWDEPVWDGLQPDVAMSERLQWVSCDSRRRDRRSKKNDVTL